MAVADSLKNFASPRYITLTIIGVSLLMVFSFLSFRLSEPIMSTLYTNLNSSDSVSVVTELGALGVKFEVKSGGSEILVESPEVLKVRMLLAQKGLPAKANIVGYEIFDKESMLGTSNFVMNVNLVRALEGELARTISSMGSIKSARVHLVIPRRDIFRRGNFEPSASVVLTLNNLLDVPKAEAQAVRHLVSSAVPGLSANRITIVDSNGKVLAKARNEGDQGAGAGSGMDTADYKFQMEERYRNQIVSMLEQVIGVGKVEANVTVDMSFEKSSEISETYDPDGQVARSTQTTEAIASSAGTGGEVSVANELTGAGGAGGGGENSQKTDEITNFEISKRVVNRVKDGGDVEKVSVAVLVDGLYTTNNNGEENYAPRSDEQLDQIRTLVRSAVGYNEQRGDRVDVVNMQFSRSGGAILQEEGVMDWLKRDLNSIIKTLVLGIVAVLTIMLVIRPLVNKAFNVSAADIEAQEIKMMANNEALAQAAAAVGTVAATSSMPDELPSSINLDMIQSRSDSSPATRVNEMIDSNPDETLSIIRAWLADNTTT